MASTINATTSAGGGVIASGDASGILALQTAGTTAVTIDASQNVGIGTSSPQTRLTIQDVGSGANIGMLVRNGDATNFHRIGIGYNAGATTGYIPTNAVFVDSAAGGGYGALGGLAIGTSSSAPVIFGTNATERARIDSSGNLLVGTTDAGISTGVGLKLLTGTTTPAYVTVLNTSAANSAYFLYNTNATNNGYRFYVGANGGINNYSANNVNISDERTKTNIENAGDYLAKICAIPVRTFKYKDQSDDLLNLGVIAQEVEAVAPELVDASGFGETPEDGVPLKAIYQTDLQYALMKCIQEQQALINQLTTRLEALEAK